MELIVRYFKEKKPVIELKGQRLYPIDDDACDRIIDVLLVDTHEFNSVTDYRIS